MTRFAYALLLTAVTAAFPAFADEDPQNRGALCSLLPVERPVVPADYVPGVDVKGKPVAPADLTAQRMMRSVDYVTIPITIDLAQNLQQTLPAGTEMNAYVATLDIHKDGKVLFNGQDVTSRAYTICDMNMPEIEPATGQEPATSAPQTVSTPADPVQKEAAPAAPAEEEAAADKPITQDDIIWGEGY